VTVNVPLEAQLFTELPPRLSGVTHEFPSPETWND
jgi:hypothetical protein